MIVFKKDWSKYPRSIVDTKTHNKSFLRLAKLYKEMGIEHYYFHLALLQPELQGVDPYDENLTLEQMVMIIHECDNNPWYYLREIVRDKGAGLTRADCMFKANRANIAAMWLLLASIDYIQIQPRQTGKSFGTDNNSLWLMYFRYRDTSMNLITKDETLRKSNIERLKKLRDGWPDYLNRNTKKDDNNQISLSCKELNNRYYTHVSQSSEKGANNLGRGMTSPYIDIDEGPFINHIETTVSSAMGATNAAREIARRKNMPFCTVFTTTAGNRENRDGKYVYDMMMGAAAWSERFFDSPNREELIALINTNSSGRATMVNLTFSHRQLGLSDEWLYEAIANARSEGANIDRDYFNIWTNNSTSSLLQGDLPKRIRQSELDPIDQWISEENYIFRWYTEIDLTQKYIIMVDTSDAIGRDDIGIVMLNVKDGSVVGAAAFNETNLIRFAGWLVEFLVKYTNTTLVIERRYNAQTIIDFLLLKLPEHGHDPFKRMFNRLVQEGQDGRREEFDRISCQTFIPQDVYDKHRRDFGFATDAEKRKLLYNNVMMNAAKDTSDRVHDKTLIEQILGLVVKNGRIDHSSSGHDDMVIAWLMGHWFLNHGVNLSHYGIDSSKVMSIRGTSSKTMSPEEQFALQQQTMVRERIESLNLELQSANNPYEINRLESELGVAMNQFKRNSDEGMTLDAMIAEARRVRETRNGFFGNQVNQGQLLLQRFGGMR